MSLDKMFDVTGKSVIVTGGAYGLGRAYAEILAERGAQVCVLAQLFEGFGQFGNDRIVEGVAYIGSVEPNLSHPLGRATDV